MCIRALLVAALCFCFAVVAAAQPQYDVEGSVRIPNARPSYTRLLLTGPDQQQYVTSTRDNGQFLFRDVPAGQYMLEAQNIDYTFSLYKVDISAVRDRISITLHTAASLLSPTQLATRVGYPLTLQPIGHNTYFQHREPFSPLSLLKQPMALMMLFMLVMVVAVPRMMGGMSEEEKREMAQMQSNMSIQGLLGKMEKKVAEVKAGDGGSRARLRD